MARTRSRMWAPAGRIGGGRAAVNTCGYGGAAAGAPVGELEGKVAVVTGAGRGIGAASARELGRAGARGLVNFRSDEAAAQVVAADIPRARAVRADVSTTDGCAALATAALEWGSFDILVNNAGITRDGLAVRMTDAQFDDVICGNV